MNTLTQTARRRQAIVLWAKKKGVSSASARYQISRPTVYKWLKRYDGTFQSLYNQSKRPKHHPNQHTQKEIKLIRDMRRRNPKAGLVVLWVKLGKRGYRRSISGLYKALKRLGEAPRKLKNPKDYKPKPYEKMSYPGQRVQIDVKFVPRVCCVGDASVDGGYFQYTFIDEYSRYRILGAYKEHSTYSSADFIKRCVREFDYAVECVQTDNGVEFTNRLLPTSRKKQTLFEKTLEELGITHKLIRPYTPRHNGKVERSHRKDNEYFYATHSFYSFQDFQTQLARWQRKYNDFPMRPLDWKSPKQVLKSFPLSVNHD